jgi:polyphosphate glucokinase
MTEPADVVFLLDVDNTLLDNDRVNDDLQRYLTKTFGDEYGRRYWTIFEQQRKELGYADYLGTLQRYRLENPSDPNFLHVSFYLLKYSFANRLYAGSLDVIEHLGKWGPTVILSDGDVIFQPRKVQRSGLYEAVDGRVLICIHKEQQLADIEQRYPARHYVLIDDKLRILTAFKKAWGGRLTTVFPRQGHYALDLEIIAANPAADITVERIGELVKYNMADMLAAAAVRAASATVGVSVKTADVPREPMKVLVIDVGGTHVKLLATGQDERRKFASGPLLTAEEMVLNVLKAAKDWDYRAASIGYPGPVLKGKPVAEPHNLGPGWVGFDFQSALGCPVKIINDAAMQALGSYNGGRMLFLGLGTGLGSAMVMDGVVEPMEIGHLPYRKATYEDYIGYRGVKRFGKKKWRRYVEDAVTRLIAALEPDDVVLGGGNMQKLKILPPGCRAGDNANAFKGGFLMWDNAPEFATSSNRHPPQAGSL